MLETLTLTPWVALPLFLAMVLCGRAFRENWKAQAEGWQTRAWLYGVPAAACLLVLAFVPMVSG